MLWIKELGRRLRMLLLRDKFDRELREEMQLHMELRAKQHAERGTPEEKARAMARRQFGNTLALREQSRDAWGWIWLEQLLLDTRLAARQLWAAPGFTIITVLTLALGIGATTAIFSAVNPILFKSLPYPDADRIMAIWEIRGDGSRSDGTFGMYRGLAERNHSLDAMAVFRPWQPTMTSVDQPERLNGQLVSAGYFRVLGVQPVLGRDFTPADDRENGPNVVILSSGLWRRRFNADPAIVGRQITLNGGTGAVIGVMADGFENVPAPSAEIWSPMQYGMSQDRAWGHHLHTVGRLRPGVAKDDAARELKAIGLEVIKEQRPVTYGANFQLIAVSLQDDITRGVRPALLAIMGAVALVLIVACVNVTNLLLARGVNRRGEFALRAALGAGRGRLIRQLLTESLFLSAIGGILGMAVAALGVRGLVALSPPGLPRVHAIGVDSTVFAFGLEITTIVGLIFGLIPALQAAQGNPHNDIQRTSWRTTSGHRRVRAVLVAAEVALALVLLVSSGLLLRSLRHLFAVEAGFNSAGLLTMQVQTAGRRLAGNLTTRFFEEALNAVRAVPGVTAAAMTSQLPMSGDSDVYGVHFESSPVQSPREDHSAFRYAVSPGYIETMGIPLRGGRLFTERDREGAPLVALINESYARRNFPGMNPIGQRLRVGPSNGPLYTIVGIVGDVKQMSLALSQTDAVYIPPSQWRFPDNPMSLVIRARGDAAELIPAIRQAVWSIDKDQPVVRVAMMDDLLAVSAAERRFALIIFEAFALAALVLAAAGLYGVLAGSVAERTREIGVRAALGATRLNILALVVRQGLLLTGFGVAIGLGGAVAASFAIAAMLFGVSQLDPATYAGVVALLAAVAAIACLVPAWRAARVDPATTLRSE